MVVDEGGLLDEEVPVGVLLVEVEPPAGGLEDEEFTIGASGLEDKEFTIGVLELMVEESKV